MGHKQKTAVIQLWIDIKWFLKNTSGCRGENTKNISPTVFSDSLPHKLRSERRWADPLQPIKRMINSDAPTRLKNFWKGFMRSRSLQLTLCTFQVISEGAFLCSRTENTNSHLPADYGKCCLKLPVTIHGVRAHEEPFNWQLRTKKKTEVY